MQNVIFLMYHGMGHFNACFQLAKMLRKDYNVVFAGVEFFKQYMEGQGFMYYTLKSVPFGMGFENWVNEQDKSKHPYLDSLKDRWTDRLYKQRETELTQLIKDVPPDYLLIDSFQSTDFIVLYPYLKANPVKVGFIQTMLPTIVRDDCPPINSLVFPDDAVGIKKSIKQFRLTRYKKRIKQKLLYFGMDDNTIIGKRMKRNAIPSHYRSSEITLRGVSFQNIDQLILAPKEFDFVKNSSTAFSHYIGFLSDKKRLEISDIQYFKIDSLIREKLKNTNGTLFYCSFGSVKSKDTRAVNIFIKKLLNVVTDGNCVLIISINSVHHDSAFETIPENVYFLKAAPQLEILRRADVFITHGGLNSIKESINAGVPMLVYPLHSTTDTMGNSTRVVYHKLGLRGDLQKDTEEDIGEKLEELIDNDIYKRNIYELCVKDDQYPEKFMELFKNLKAVL